MANRPVKKNPWLILPGVGVGDIRLGMNPMEVNKILDTEPTSSKDFELDGRFFKIEGFEHANLEMYYEKISDNWVLDLINVYAFPVMFLSKFYITKEGICLGDHIEKALNVFGIPTISDDHPDGSTIAEVYARYDNKGIAFSTDDALIVHIGIYRPAR
ncbi:hypothetical protein TDSAC_1144 [Thermodesulfobium acidiphilum]|uniref:Uncharacterized protein n=1 Tax=Thermodesulfobium acidiphilum TaxID=1794699 RepID=A0A2R4W0Z9_THEAF|nr:hypothetical protein [Thermodesulfobium acidiphilum]AWB10489.1 hypothetical protein TDSAC_1144 [Thermodesulfobium acidiphilum]PMP84586.1 MAG: hypothetical protein C0174_06925 [Thermodesulfobium narugense]